MAKRKYTPQVQKSLGDVLQQRKDFYAKTLYRAFEGFRDSLPKVIELAYEQAVVNLDRAYKCGNLSKIEEAERKTRDLTNKLGRVNEIASSFSQLIGYEGGQPAKITRDNALMEIPGEVARPTVDNRPRLTFYQFARAKDKGMSLEEIKAKFRLKSNYQIGGFAKWYNERNKKGKKK